MPNKGTMNAKQKRAGSLGQSSRLYNMGNKLVSGGQGFNNLQFTNNSTTSLTRIKNKRALIADDSKICYDTRYRINFGGFTKDLSYNNINRFCYLTDNITQATIFRHNIYTELKETLEEVKYAIEDIIHGPELKCVGINYDMTIFLNIMDFSANGLKANASAGSGELINVERYTCPTAKFPFAQEVMINKTQLLQLTDTRDNKEPFSFNRQILTPFGHRCKLLFNALLHEILHGIGVGNSKWESYLDASKNWYIGPQNSRAVKEYQDITEDPSLNRIPVENQFGAGTQEVHWEEGEEPSGNSYKVERRMYNSKFHPAIKDEVLTGFLSGREILTRMTVGFLEDMGYKVNFDSKYIMSNEDVIKYKLVQSP